MSDIWSAGDIVRSSAPTISTTGFTIRVRQLVQQQYSGRCWLCNFHYTQACHVIAHADRSFHRLIGHGLITFTNVNDFENCVPLCPLCHLVYDNHSIIGFAFFPADLEFFIQCELRDYERRLSAARGGDIAGLQRQAPTKETYRQHQIDQGLVAAGAAGGLYQAYVFDEELRAPLPVPLKIWHGAPMATLRKTLLIYGNTFTNAIPQQVRNQLRFLQDLYMRTDPEVLAGTGNNQGPGPGLGSTTEQLPEGLASPAAFMAAAGNFAHTFGPAIGPSAGYGRYASGHVRQQPSGSATLLSARNKILLDRSWGATSTSEEKSKVWIELLGDKHI